MVRNNIQAVFRKSGRGDEWRRSFPLRAGISIQTQAVNRPAPGCDMHLIRAGCHRVEHRPVCLKFPVHCMRCQVDAPDLAIDRHLSPRLLDLLRAPAGCPHLIQLIFNRLFLGIDEIPKSHADV